MAAPSAVDRVADALRDEILTGRLLPGTPLREEVAAERFGVSRHTLRAAFQRLVSERLAVTALYRGVRVTQFDGDQIRALQELRIALETEAVRIAQQRFGTGHWPDDVLAPARAALDAMERLGESAAPGEADAAGASGIDWLAAERLHADFHSAVVAASGSVRIVEAHGALGSELLLFLLQVRPHYSLRSLVVEHRELLDALPSRGPEAVRAHLEHSTALLLGESSPPAE